MPRAGLTPAVVTATAADLADEIGWQQLTLTAVAGRLGVRQPSLYKHVASLAALRRSVSTLAVGELADRLTAAVVGRSGEDALAHLAAAYRAFAHAHPGRYAASVVAPSAGDTAHIAAGDAALRTLAATLRGFEAAGDAADPGAASRTPAGESTADAHGTLANPSIVHTIRALRAMLHGFVALEAAGGFAMAIDLDESYRRMVAGFAHSIAAPLGVRS